MTRRAESTEVGVNYEIITHNATSHAETAPALQGTQNASVAYHCISAWRQEATLRRDKFSF